MFEHEIQLRVRYGETDQMGYVYYGNYATYFEVARVEALRHLGFSYKEIEESGILMPVLDFKTNYIKPAKYDDLLRIRVFIKDKPTIRIKFNYEVLNETGTIINTAETTLVFINKSNNRPCLPSEHFREMIQKYFS